MKKLIPFALVLLTFHKGYTQKSCCSKPNATEQFAMLTSDEKFVDTHLNPEPFSLENEKGNNITFPTSDGLIGHGYEIKSSTKSNNYIIVVHEWWGLNDYIKQEVEKIYSRLENVNVIAVDLYDNKVANNKDSAAKYMQAVKFERAENIVKGLLAYAGKDANFYTIGWCFGGGWSLQTSLLAGDKSKACVMYYGMPEENLEKLKNLKSPVFFVWPTQDQWINKEVVTKFESNMKTLNKSLVVKSFEADHAFANPSNPKFNKEYSALAFNQAMEFIKTTIKK